MLITSHLETQQKEVIQLKRHEQMIRQDVNKPQASEPTLEEKRKTGIK